MIRKENLQHFKQMWKWLCGYPSHDRTYYVKHVLKSSESWLNNCPLANSEVESFCTGCEGLWATSKGNLCTDSNSPLYKWNMTEPELPDYRSYYASQVAVLAVKKARDMEKRVESCRYRKQKAA